MAPRRPRRIPLVERIAAALSVAIVAGTLGYLVYETFQADSEAPALTAVVLGTSQRDGTFVVEVEIRNGSRAAAADVHVTGAVPSRDGSERLGFATVDYVPGFSSRRVSLIFDVDPGPSPAVRIVGYTTP